jgi:hypothetical protein
VKKPVSIGPERFRCHNAVFGCGQRFVTAAYNHQVTACHYCCSAAARRWGLDVQFLDHLLVAFQTAKSAKNGATPGPIEVWPLLAKMGLKPKPPMEKMLPERDRSEAA